MNKFPTKNNELKSITDLMNIDAKPVARIAEEEHFHKLFVEVLDYLKDEHSIHDIDIRRAIDRLISSFRHDLSHKFSDIDLSRTDNVCGYLYHYAIHGAGLMRHKTLQALRGCPDLSRTLRQPALKVVSLQGGPGHLVGFLSALHQLGPRGCHLNVTVVDAMWQWAPYLRLIKHFARVGNFGSVSQLFRDNAVDLKFVRSTLPGFPVEHKVCYIELEYADVVVVCEVISALHKKSQLIAYLHHTLNESALVILLDCPFEYDLWKDFEVLYVSQRGERYQLDQEYDRNPHYRGLSPVTSNSRIAILRKK